MEKPSTSILELSRRLLAAEAEVRTAADSHEANLVCEKLRGALTRLAGAEGFVALMRRSLALARADVPALKNVELRADGCIESFDNALFANGDGAEAGTALTAHFLWLLVTFVGEPIALRLVRETWPAVVTDE